MKFTAEQLIKYCILAYNADYENTLLLSDLSPEQVEDLYDEAECLQDDIYEVRVAGVETDIEPERSRHYESKSVAMAAPNGQWVGWTCWYGGGKHGEPEEIEWISKAYLLDVLEEEKLVIVRTFSKAGC